MKLKFCLSLLSLVVPALTNAQSVATSPSVGFVKVTVPANSDTRVSAPLSRIAVYQGGVASVSGNQITLQGETGFTNNQFVSMPPDQPNTYYVSINSGAKAGMYYTITGNSTTSVTVDLAGDTIAGAVVANDTLKIIPYWTLATLFPNQSGITTTTAINGTGNATRVLVPDFDSTGINLPSRSIYYYYSGTGFGGPGWRKLGGGFTNKRDNEIIPPDAYVILRQREAASTVATVAGAVPTSRRAIVVNVNAPNTAQDNAVSVEVPVPVTLAQSKLADPVLGAFAGSPDIDGSTGDRLLVWDDTLVGHDKPSARIYYYYTGSGSGGPGWRLLGGSNSAIQDDEPVFQPGTGVVIRKQAQPSAGTQIWHVPLIYNP